jgi:putative FmdB family regulatory protein
MPTYDYKCSACGHTFDELQSFSEPPLTKCPKCKKNKLERLFGGGGAIIFKGSGFYETDYRRSGATEGKSEGGESKGGESKEAKADAPAASGDAPAKGETKSEAKSPPKGESKGGGGSKKKDK